MPQDHDHGTPNYSTAFAVGVALNVIVVVIEVVFGLRARSMALLADAGHNVGDVLGLLLGWTAFILAARKPTRRRTYGFRRVTILASLASAGLLLITVGGIIWESIQRFGAAPKVHTTTVVIVAAVGILVNGGTALMFMAGRKKDLNIKGAFLHMAGDMLVSVGVIVAAVIIHYTGLFVIDPVVGILIGVMVFLSTWGLLRDSIGLAIDAVPGSIDPDKVAEYLESIPGVTRIHDLHIWGISTTQIALTAHLVMPGATADDALHNRIADELHDKFEIVHTTIQVERGDDEPCPRDGEAKAEAAAEQSANAAEEGQAPTS